MKQPFYSLIVISFLFSCSFNSKDTSDIIRIDIDNSKTIEPLSVIDSIQMINLETNEKSLIGKVKKLIIYNNIIFVLDSRQQALLRFSSKGKFLNKIHKIGKGPGEYISINDFCIDKTENRIILLANGRNILTYSFEGKYIGSSILKNYVCHYIEWLGKDEFLLFSDTDEYRFCFFNLKKNEIVKKSIPNNDFAYKTGFGHLHTPFMQKKSNSYYCTDLYSYKIFNISFPGKITLEKLDFGIHNNSVIPLDLGAERYKERYKEMILNGKYAMNIFYFFESSNYYFTSYFFNKKIQTSILDKRNNCNYFLDKYEFPQVKYFSDDSLFAIFEPLSLEKYVPESFMSKTKKMEININDNPIVIVYKFKRDV